MSLQAERTELLGPVLQGREDVLEVCVQLLVNLLYGHRVYDHGSVLFGQFFDDMAWIANCHHIGWDVFGDD